MAFDLHLWPGGLASAAGGLLSTGFTSGAGEGFVSTGFLDGCLPGGLCPPRGRAQHRRPLASAFSAALRDLCSDLAAGGASGWPFDSGLTAGSLVTSGPDCSGFSRLLAKEISLTPRPVMTEHSFPSTPYPFRKACLRADAFLYAVQHYGHKTSMPPRSAVRALPATRATPRPSPAIPAARRSGSPTTPKPRGPAGSSQSGPSIQP